MEARVAGAGGVPVILRMLARTEIVALMETAAALGLFVLLEAFDEADLDLAGELAEGTGERVTGISLPVLVGLNCRDLATLQVVPGRLEALAPRLPQGLPRVAERPRRRTGCGTGCRGGLPARTRRKCAHETRDARRVAGLDACGRTWRVRTAAITWLTRPCG